MSGTSSAVLIVLFICLTIMFTTFVAPLVRDQPSLPWRCRILGSHKFIASRANYIQEHCLRCGYPRTGRMQ